MKTKVISSVVIIVLFVFCSYADTDTRVLVTIENLAPSHGNFLTPHWVEVIGEWGLACLVVGNCRKHCKVTGEREGETGKHARMAKGGEER